MGGFAQEEHSRAIHLMAEARKILFHELHCPGGLCRELIEGVDRLGLSFEFAENPDEPIVLCPQCECLYWEETAEGKRRCLSCDHEWRDTSG